MRYRETSTASASFGSGSLGIGDIQFAAEANARSLGPVSSLWVHAGFPNREFSILILRFVLPPVIHDKNRMR
jgi:hypothetical protein